MTPTPGYNASLINAHSLQIVSDPSTFSPRPFAQRLPNTTDLLSFVKNRLHVTQAKPNVTLS
jgi:hypothetical protein